MFIGIMYSENMSKFFFSTFLVLAVVGACSYTYKSSEVIEEEKPVYKRSGFVLKDFYSENPFITSKVDSIFNQLSDTAIVAQLLMPAIGKYGQTETTIKKHVKEGLIGGLLLLNGTKDQFKTWVDDLEGMNKSLGNLPFLYSADAEPSLVNRKIIGSTPVKKANLITTEEEVISVTQIITKDLLDIGINYNFSPVVDMAKNSTVGYRGFGSNPQNIIPWSDAFIQKSQAMNVMATAKHFPGHGLVSGDTHKALQVIDGELKEVKNYPALIENGVLSIMVAHIAVKNNPKFDTKGLPATTSKVIVSDLLRDSLGFKGLIVTDAMNMGGVVNVPDSEIKTIDAGCDIVLMPVDAEKAHKLIYTKYMQDPEFKRKVEAAAKRVIRAKICLGLIK